MTRLALFHPSFAVSGGAEFLIASQARALRAEGFDLKLVTGAFDARRWASAFEGIPVAVYPKPRSPWDLLAPWDRVGKLRRRAEAPRPHLEDQDTVLAYNFPASAILGHLGVAARTLWQCNEPPRNLHARQANPRLAGRVDACGRRPAEDATEAFRRSLARFDQRARPGTSFAARRAFDLQMVARLDEVFAISAFSRDNARAIYGRCSDTVVYPIVRFPEGGHARPGLDRSGLQVLVQSRLEPVKNIDTVIRGFARFRARACPGARLHVVGEGEHRPRLEALARECLGAEGWIFHGFLPDAALRAVYEACDVFACLPLDEPFGMVFPEAAAKGLLLVGPDHGGPLEILDGGRLGWVCDPFDPDAVAGAFEAIWALDDEEVQRRRSETDRACRARYAEAAVLPALRGLLKGG